MKAALLDCDDAPLNVADIPDPACPRDGGLIEVGTCGLSRSDHHAWKGVDPDIGLPHIMGHEFAGVVIAPIAVSGSRRFVSGKR